MMTWLTCIYTVNSISYFKIRIFTILTCLPFVIAYKGLPRWLNWERICLQCGRPRFNLWVGKIPWRRKWQPTLLFLPGKPHGQRNLVGYSIGVTRVRYNLANKPPPTKTLSKLFSKIGNRKHFPTK